MDSARRLGGSLFQTRGAAWRKERLVTLREEVHGGRWRVRQEEERVERGGWMVSKRQR